MGDAYQIELRIATAAENAAFTGAAGELVFEEDNNLVYIHDGSTPGGHLMPRTAAQILALLSGQALAVGSVTANTVDATGSSITINSALTVNDAVGTASGVAIFSWNSSFGAVARSNGAANSGLNLETNGTGPIRFATNNGNNLQAQVNHTAAAVNQVTFTGGATGTGATIGTAGSDGAIPLILAPKSSVVQFGTHTAIGAEALSGYITINDSGGTPRKLAVVS